MTEFETVVLAPLSGPKHSEAVELQILRIRTAVNELANKASIAATRLRQPEDRWVIYELVRTALEHLTFPLPTALASALYDEGVAAVEKALEEPKK